MKKFRIVLLIGLMTLTAAAQATQKPKPIDQLNVPPVSIRLLKPDFQIRNIWFAKFLEPNPNQVYTPINGGLKLNEKVFLICDMVNAGGSQKGLWRLGYFVDNLPVWNNSWGDLAANQTLRGVGVYTPTAEGIHAYRVFLDELTVVVESNENNNQKEIQFKVVK